MLDLTAGRYGRLIVVREAERIGYTRRWLCRCDCGTEKVIAQGQLRTGKTTSCGCYNREQSSKSNLVDLTGRRFGKLTVIARAKEKHHTHKAPWECRCDCGNTVSVLSVYLTQGDTQSCGCHRSEQGVALQSYNETHLRVDGVFTPLLTSKLRTDNTTGIKGVSRVEKKDKVLYRATIKAKGHQYFLGDYTTIEAAAKARKAGEEKYHNPYLMKGDDKE